MRQPTRWRQVPMLMTKSTILLERFAVPFCWVLCGVLGNSSHLAPQRHPFQQDTTSSSTWQLVYANVASSTKTSNKKRLYGVHDDFDNLFSSVRRLYTLVKGVSRLMSYVKCPHLSIGDFLLIQVHVQSVVQLLIFRLSHMPLT